MWKEEKGKKGGDTQGADPAHLHSREGGWVERSTFGESTCPIAMTDQVVDSRIRGNDKFGAVIDWFFAKILSMKLWFKDTSTTTHHIIYFTGENAQNTVYLGDLDDAAFKEYLLTLSSKIDIEKNLKLIHYFGYLHIFAKKES